MLHGNRDSRLSSGFSLVELMVVIGIIGIILTLATPRVQRFLGKARQAEAKTNLKHIHTLETLYHESTGYYGPNQILSREDYTSVNSCNVANPIGFQLTDCTKVRYQYSIAGASPTDYRANASESDGRVLPGCNLTDAWQIHAEGILIHTFDPWVNGGCR